MFSLDIRNIAREGSLGSFKLVCASVEIRPVKFRLTQGFRQNMLKEGGYFSQAIVLTEKFKFQGWSESFGSLRHSALSEFLHRIPPLTRPLPRP